MMDVLLKLELGAYVMCVCTLSLTAGRRPLRVLGVHYPDVVKKVS